MIAPAASDMHASLPRLTFAVCVLFYAALVAIGFNDIEEDAFIYFRFAANIADGYGYVFNVGGERIESCSGLLWLGMLVLLQQLPLHIVLATKLLCFVFGVLCIREVLVLSQRFIADRTLALFPAFLMVASIPFYTWSVRGLETALYWFVYLWLFDWASNPARMRHWWLPALAVLNSRPEGFLMLTAVLPYLFFFERKTSYFWRNCLWIAVGFAAVTAWRFWYFHDLVPHPFYFKVNPDHAQSLRNLLTYGWHSGWLLLALLALPGLRKPWQRRDLVLLNGLLLSLLWAVFVFEDKVYNRHTGVALPFVYVAALMLIARGWPAARMVQYGLRAVMAALILFTLLFSRYVHFRDSHASPFLANAMRAVLQAGSYWPELVLLLRDPDNFNAQPQGLGVFNIRYNLIASVGDFVRLNYRDDVVVIYDQIGQAPWYAGQKTFFIDNLGLGYREIGLSHFHDIAEASPLYGAYERLLQRVVQQFWPQEQRYYSDEELLVRLLARNADVVIARKGLISNNRQNLLVDLLRSEVFQQRYRAAYLLNNREIIFERVAGREEFVRALSAVKVPSGARLQRIEAFNWCDGSPCMQLSALP